METNTPLNKEEILAILKANRELGPLYDGHTADQILELIQGQKLRETATDPMTARDQRRAMRRELRENRRGGSLGSAIPLFALSIPLLAIAGGKAGGLGIFAVLGLDAIVVLATVFRR